MDKKTMTRFYVIILAIGLVLVANGLILAWTGPSANPPSGNVSSPINVGATDQFKTGALGASTGGVDPSYGLTVGTNNTSGIKSDRWSWFGSGMAVGGVLTASDIRTSILRDREDTSFILNPAGASRLDVLNVVSALTVAGQNVCRQNGVNCPTINCSSCDTRFINVGESGDSIADNTIDASELEANSVGDSEMIDNPAFNQVGIGTTPVTDLHVKKLQFATLRLETTQGTADSTLSITQRYLGDAEYNTNGWHEFQTDGGERLEIGDKGLLISGGLNFTGQTGYLCLPFRACPTGWTDKGIVSLITNPASACPYTVGGVYGGGPAVWCEARMCCSQSF